MYHSSLSIHHNADFIVESSDCALTIYAVDGDKLDPIDYVAIGDSQAAHIELTLFGFEHLTGHQVAAILAKRLNEMLAKRMEEANKKPVISEEEESWQSSVNPEPIL